MDFSAPHRTMSPGTSNLAESRLGDLSGIFKISITAKHDNQLVIDDSCHKRPMSLFDADQKVGYLNANIHIGDGSYMGIENIMGVTMFDEGHAKIVQIIE